MRLVVPLLAALVLAGCSILDREQPPATTTAPTATTPVTTSAPPATTSTPPSTTSTPPTQTTTPTPNGTADKPADYHANESGFVDTAATPGSPYVKKIAIPVLAGALNLSANVKLTTDTPAGAAPLQTDNVTLSVLDPEGKRIAYTSNVAVVTDSSASHTVRAEKANLTRAGEYQLVIEVTGLGDGSALGQKWAAAITVKY